MSKPATTNSAVIEAKGHASEWTDACQILRRKWGTVPAGGNRRQSTQHLLSLADDELLQTWQAIRTHDTTTALYSHRGWYHDLYRNVLNGKRVADIGSGMGLDGITFAQAGAVMTFVDLVSDNLRLIERLCTLLSIDNATFLPLDAFSDLQDLNGLFDVIWAQGSLHHAPQNVVRHETAMLLEHLPIGGRWIQLAYPRQRWDSDGRMPFEKWGEITDGPGTPWAEWYDVDKLLALLAPARFDVVLDLNIRNGEFVWFDLVRCA